MFEKEYETLRAELSDNKKFVFERPLLIITAALLFTEYITGTNFAMLFPNIVIYLLLFNFKFTSNRLNSSSRIVSYIRLFIEKKEPKNYQWETFLYEYRKDEKDKGLRYYPIIYWFHILTVIIFISIEIFLYFDNQIDFSFNDIKKETITIISILLCLIGIFFLIKLGIEATPNKIYNYFVNEISSVEKTIENMKKESTPPNSKS